MQLLVKIVKDCESRGIFRTQQSIKMELFVEKVNILTQGDTQKNGHHQKSNNFWNFI